VNTRIGLPAERLLLGIGLRLGAIITFSAMSATVKLVSDRGVGPAEMLFYRNLFSLPIIAGWIIAVPGIRAVRTRRPLAHLTRGLIGMTSMLMVFQTLRMLPLAEATTIGFSAPLFATILSGFWLGEHVGPHRWLAVAIGFAGVLVVLQPGGLGPHLGIAVAIVSAFLVASVNITLRQLGATENIAATVFWFNLTTLAVMSAIVPFFARAHNAEEWGLLVVIGITGGAAQIFNTASVRYAPLAALAPFDYLQLVGAAIFGYLLWGTSPGRATWTGASLIVAGGLYTIYREHRLRQAIAAVELPVS
jgi:drug/metabolite transporter (DMT)-like permease